MLVKVLKAFPYSENGRSPQYLEPSDDPDARVDIRDDLCPGLSGEGYIDGVEHGLPLLSEGRRSAILDRIVARGRADLAKLGDERLLEMAAQLDALVAAESATRCAGAGDEDRAAARAGRSSADRARRRSSR
jgi:hypothetical protein